MQRRYWNGLADEYHRITRITLDDFHYGPQIPGEAELRLLPPLRKGQSALELGCGGAENSVWLARQGLNCTAVDLSAAQLRHARATARKAGVDIAFVRAPLETFHEQVGGRFDLIHSSHALEFVDAPADILAHAAKLLKPGGTLVLSTVHPLYNGDWIDATYEDGDGTQSGGAGLFLASYFSPPDDVRNDAHGEVVSRAYPVSAWFGWLRAASLEVVQMAEPPAVPDGQTPPYTSDDWAVADGELHAIPGTLIFVARKGRKCNSESKHS
jgi:2-polyprenyl-3-methyl-5-hydroxy-6-metoxy-1,4-benzoquinol methylase